MNKYRLSTILIILALFLVACQPVATPQTAAPEDTPALDTPQPAVPATLTVMTHDSFSASEEIIRQFEQENNVTISFLLSGDTGSTLNRAILTRESPMADVLYGVDNTFLSRALDADIFETYPSPLLAYIPDSFELDDQFRALPVNYGDVCINYDRSYFEENNLAIPQSLQDLTRPEYRGLLVVQNPATSSPGLAFMLATIAEFGEDGWIDFWRALRANGVVVVNSWETAYYTNFSGSAGRGPQPMVVSYGSSPPAEVIFAEQPLDEAPTASITAPNTCFRQIEFSGILRGTQQRELAERFIDFMLSVPFQEDIPLQMFVFPVNQQANLPQAFIDFAQIPDQPATLAPELIAANRERWMQEWDDTVLR
ncbi:MAG TPA: thiamine ABC transporter substrate-binding protein [Levilinea sp.]|nr:thiamine ABC transporter substrate-binding protein [Levilinea sp.]